MSSNNIPTVHPTSTCPTPPQYLHNTIPNKLRSPTASSGSYPISAASPSPIFSPAHASLKQSLIRLSPSFLYAEANLEFFLRSGERLGRAW